MVVVLGMRRILTWRDGGVIDMECEHDWRFVDNWHENIDFSIKMISIPIVCKLCGMKAFENHIVRYSCVTDEDGEFVEG